MLLDQRVLTIANETSPATRKADALAMVGANVNQMLLG
jgi:hypothetical protein